MGWRTPMLRVGTILPVVLLAALVPGAPAAPRTLPLMLTVHGSGIVRDRIGREVTCKTTYCRATFQIRVGSQIRLAAQPKPGWKFTGWAGACRGTTSPCKIHLTRATRVGVTFVPPGAKANPIPLGQSAVVRKDWLMKVGTVTPNANDQVLAANNNDPFAQVPAGAQDFMVSLSITYQGAGSSDVGIGVVGYVETVGSHNKVYDTNTDPCPGAWPDPSFKYTEQKVFSGQSTTGNVCYLIAANDADSLMMFVYSGESDQTKVWFALK